MTFGPVFLSTSLYASESTGFEIIYWPESPDLLNVHQLMREVIGMKLLATYQTNQYTVHTMR